MTANESQSTSIRLTGTQRRVLDHLTAPMYVGALIDRLSTHPVVILKSIRGLIKHGLIVKTSSPGYEYVMTGGRSWA